MERVCAMSGHDDFAFEPIPGLPERLPLGEEMLWQGRPDAGALAREAYGIRWIAGYFTLIVLWRATVGFGEAGLAGALAMGLPYLGLAGLGCALVYLLAVAQARATIYTITSSRVVMRIGAALTVTFNFPFVQIAAAHLDDRGRTGTIALQTKGETRISFLILWPHTRPWQVARTQPALRCIPDAAAVAKLLAEAAQTRLSEPVITREPGPAGDLVAAE
jgi:Bacterial PH domain